MIGYIVKHLTEFSITLLQSHCHSCKFYITHTLCTM